jgi:prevent-host-death family protein
MQFVSICDAKSHLSRYIKQVNETDDPVVICKYGKPIVQLVKYAEKTKRKLGLWKGQVIMHENFDETPEDWQGHFH